MKTTMIGRTTWKNRLLIILYVLFLFQDCFVTIGLTIFGFYDEILAIICSGMIFLNLARNHFVIKESDDEKITTIVFRLNQDDNQYWTLNIADMNYNDIQYVVPMELQSGENTIEVTIKNASGVTEESGIIKYQK